MVLIHQLSKIESTSRIEGICDSMCYRRLLINPSYVAIDHRKINQTSYLTKSFINILKAFLCILFLSPNCFEIF